MEILNSRLFTSAEPTIENSISSPDSRSFKVTAEPRFATLWSISSSEITTAFLIRFSSSSIFASLSRCSSLAASYSAFSERSPCSRASLILSAISLRMITLRSCNSSSSFFRPSTVIIFFSAMTVTMPFYGLPAGSLILLISYFNLKKRQKNLLSLKLLYRKQPTLSTDFLAPHR